MDGERLLSVDEAAEFLGVKRNTILVWRTNGRHQIPAIKLGNNILRYRLRDLQAFAEAHAEPAVAVDVEPLRGPGRPRKVPVAEPAVA